MPNVDIERELKLAQKAQEAQRQNEKGGADKRTDMMPRELITVVWTTADAMAMAIAAVETVVGMEVLVVVVMMVDVGRMMVRRVAKAETGGIVQY